MAATKESGYGYSNLLISNEIIEDKIVILYKCCFTFHRLTFNSVIFLEIFVFSFLILRIEGNLPFSVHTGLA